jgi:PAS domain S-box-containing protein
MKNNETDLDTEKLLLDTINIEDIPEIPASVKIAISSTLKGEKSIEELLRTVRESPSISLKILKVANSPIYGRERPVSNLKDAVVLLGYKTVKSIILSITIHEIFNNKESDWFDHKRFFLHSLATAILCEEFAKRAGTGREEDMYAAGILHDIGKAILFLSDNKRYKKVVDRVVKEKITFREAENLEFGFDHTDAARFLLKFWEIPERLIAPACDYHRFDIDRYKGRIPDTAIVRVANESAHIIGYDTHTGESRYNSSGRMLEKMGILSEELDQIVQETKERIEVISEVLNLQKSDLRGFFELISEANQELGNMWMKNQQLLVDLKRKDRLLASLSRISDVALEEKNLETAISDSMRELCTFFRLRRASCEFFINDDKSLVLTFYRTCEKTDGNEVWEQKKQIGKRGEYKPQTKIKAFRIQTAERNILGNLYLFDNIEEPDPEELELFLQQLALGLNHVKLFFTNKLKNERLNILVNKLQEETEKGKRMAEINRLILHNSPVGILSVDKKGKIIQSNPQAAKLLDEVLAERNLFDLDTVAKTGLEVPLKKLLKEGKSHETVVRKQGERRSFSIESAQIEGTTQTLLIIQDITERKENERIAIQREKMATLGELAAGIAHNLRSPLAVAKGIPELILSELGSKDLKIVKSVDGKKAEAKGFRENMELISDSIVKALRVIDSIMEFSKEDFGTFEPLIISEVVEEARSLLEHRLKSKQVIFTNKTSSCVMQGNKNLLTQAFINLLNNSIDAVEEHGTIQVNCLMEKDRLVIHFEDDGKGIEEDNLERIFEPFFTTSGKANGTGIGLSVTRKLVTIHGGSIAAIPREGGGTVMELVFPTRKRENG